MAVTAVAARTVLYPLRLPASTCALSSSARLEQPASGGGYCGNNAGAAVFSRRSAIVSVTTTFLLISAPALVSAARAEETDEADDEEGTAVRIFEETSSWVVAIKDVEILQPGDAENQIKAISDENTRIEGTGSGFVWDKTGHILSVVGCRRTPPDVAVDRRTPSPSPAIVAEVLYCSTPVK
ncbi:Protease Do-like 5 [Nymphaea thermarum]|nr:Protease Do-like 5 [Nymphaea thermarum]